jgi:hypothetical protein
MKKKYIAPQNGLVNFETDSLLLVVSGGSNTNNSLPPFDSDETEEPADSRPFGYNGWGDDEEDF